MVRSLSVAPVPVPTGFREPAHIADGAYATRAIEKDVPILPCQPLQSTLNRLMKAKCDRSLPYVTAGPA